MPHVRILKSGLASVCLVLCSGVASAATWTAEAGFTVERTTEIKADGTTHTDTFDQTYALSYETKLLETLDFTLDFTLDVEETKDVEEKKDSPGGGSASTTRDSKPSVEATLVGQWWDLFGSWDETKTTNTDPAEGRTVESNWEFEAVVEPEYEILPSFRYNVQGDNQPVIDKDVELIVEYTFLDKLDASLGLSRETSDVPEADKDTDGRTIEAELGLSHALTKAINFEADWSMDRDQSLTLTDDGEILSRDDTLANELRGLLEWNILDMVTASVERDVQWDKTLSDPNGANSGVLEVTDTWTGEIEVDHDLTEALHLNLAYNDERENARPVGAHTYTITRDYTAELAYAPFEWLTVTPSFDRSDKTAWSKEPDSPTDDTLDDTYEILWEYSLWGDFLVLDVTRTWEYSWKNGEKEKKKRSWDVNVEALPLYVPNLEVTPTYSYTEDLETAPGKRTEEKTIEVDIGYEISLRDRLVLRLDHTYSRTQKWSSDPAERMTIERTDDTEVTVTWDEFLRGMGLELSWVRDASDTSEDEKPPEIDYTYSATYDWEILANYTLGFEYNRDVKQMSEDTQDFTTTVSAEFFDGRIILDLEHEFEEQLESVDGKPREKTHRYRIELHGEF